MKDKYEVMRGETLGVNSPIISETLLEAKIGRFVTRGIEKWAESHQSFVKDTKEAFKQRKPLAFLAWFYKFYQVPMYLKFADGLGSLVLSLVDYDLKRMGSNAKEAGIETVRQGFLIGLTILFVGLSGSWVVAGFGYIFVKLGLMKQEHLNKVFEFLDMNLSELAPFKRWAASNKAGATKAWEKMDKNEVPIIKAIKVYTKSLETLFKATVFMLHAPEKVFRIFKKDKKLSDGAKKVALSKAGVGVKTKTEGNEDMIEKMIDDYIFETGESPGALTLGVGWEKKPSSYFQGLSKTKGIQMVLSALNAALIYYSNRDPGIVYKIHEIQGDLSGQTEHIENVIDDYLGEQGESPGAITLGLGWETKPISYFVELVKDKGRGQIISALNAALIYYSNRSPKIVMKVQKIQKDLFGKMEGVWDPGDDILQEYQVGSGMAYMQRKKAMHRIKKPKLQRAAIKRWQKYGHKYIASMYKAKRSSRGRAITASLARFMKKQNKRYRRECLESIKDVFEEIVQTDPTIELQAAQLTNLVKCDEFLGDMALIFLQDSDLLEVYNVPYMEHVRSFMEERSIITVLEITLDDWKSMKKEWREVEKILIQEATAEYVNFGMDAFPPTARNPYVPFPVGSAPSENPMDVVTEFGNAWDYGECQICKDEYSYPMKAGDPKCCRKHGGKMAFSYPPVPEAHYPKKTMMYKNAIQ